MSPVASSIIIIKALHHSPFFSSTLFVRVSRPDGRTTRCFLASLAIHEERGIVAQSAFVIIARAANVTAAVPPAVLSAPPVSACKQGPLEVMLNAAALLAPPVAHEPFEMEAWRTPSTADSE